MNDQKYNGWANYQTWRIALEWFDENMNDMFDLKQDAVDLADDLRDYLYDTVSESVKYQFIAGYVYYFLQAVDWKEIAEHLIENNKD
jgi:hypothetical protein